ncbi:MAG: aldehyde ferredoxin oxidoreductase [Desulfobacterales bacterium]|nr:aldehyde ferredoxin oxidoreductase [Desulfobacterales bacterium]MBF0398650.1 aldehyde ferredoxin oxidoreductase [Desulfobacterales bacterium]
MAKHGGWAGKVLRVDLSTGKISTENTIEKYKDFIGGTGIGYKVIWDEVPSATKPFSPENKIIFGTGPLAGTGAPCNGKTAITTLWPTCWPKPLVASGHMGGHFAAELKYAGYDAIIIEGKSEHPVWLSIEDARVELNDARRLWGLGIRRTTYEINLQMGHEASVAAIGQAGENLVPMSVIINSVSHSAGGGAVMGSKNLKAIGVRGTGSVYISGKKEEWEKAIKFHLSLLGANNQHVVPSSPQPWAEYYSPGSRWISSKGRNWEASRPPIETGSCDPHNLNRIAYRSNNAVFFLGNDAWKYTVRGNGCTGCPIRCHTILRVPSVYSKYAIPEIGQNTCGGLNFGRAFFKTFPDGPKSQTSIEACMVGMHFADDLGIWNNYGLLQRDFQKLYYDGILKTKIDEKEYKSYSWDKFEKGDPGFLFELLPRIARKDGELATALGMGTGYMLERWGISEEDWKKDPALQYWKMGHPRHHSNEDSGQIGVIINTQYNRDAQCHSHTNFIRNGLPIEVQKRLASELWGSPDAVDATLAYTPMNIYKAKMAKWSLLRKELHDALALCNWMGPISASPLKERGYRGDDSIESLLYTLATGDKKSCQELDHVAERILLLHRAITIRDMGTKEMRTMHDTIPDWVFEDIKDKSPFSKGTNRMDKEDMRIAMDMYYEEMGWDKKTGAPTLETYRKFDLGDVAEKLKQKGLLP